MTKKQEKSITSVQIQTIEKEIEPRPNVFFPMDLAFFSLENKLLCQGITTVYHSLSFTENNTGLRTEKKIMELVETINSLKTTGQNRHYTHARYDITEPKYSDVIRNMMETELVQLISFNDHTPGQGQYKELGNYKSYMMKHRGYTEKFVDELVEKKVMRSKDHAVKKSVDSLAAAARQKNIPMASHDDDSDEKVELMHGYGVTISEFPLDLATARTASSKGIQVVVGAPNVVRGKSYSGNLSAIDAIKNGCAGIICSDYHPASVLSSIFALYRGQGINIWEAVGMASLNPAKAAGKEKELGSIECGKKADLLLVSEKRGIPEVEGVFIEGKLALAKGGCLLGNE